MNWKYKALLQLIFSNVPLGERLNYFFQRHVTKRLPSNNAKFSSIVSNAKEHIDMIERFYHRPLASSKFYEFGSGWDMKIPLAFYSFGVQQQILVDIRNLVRRDLVNDTIEKHQRLALPFALPRKPDRYIEGNRRDLVRLLKQYYGIDFKAPCDARNTHIESCSIDCITSTDTLEHIPVQDMLGILNECYRILRDDGLMSFRIDYQDHYAYFDHNISVYNFLQYSDKAWIWYSPELHYQNRLRHRDYMDLFQKSGFEVISERRRDGAEIDLQTISRLSLDAKHSAYSLPELAVRGALVVMRKRPRQTLAASSA
jgi:SAM-dependent methyltransferase